MPQKVRQLDSAWHLIMLARTACDGIEEVAHICRFRMTLSSGKADA